MTSDVRFVEFPDQVKLSYVEQGDASGVPVLLLHGFAGSWRAFELVLPHLPASLHTFALTQRGHGGASKPTEGYRLGDFAADVAAFMDAFEIEAAVVVGHSMGSGVAQRFVMDYPERTLGLVLVGACVIEPGGPELQAFWDSAVSQLTDPIDPDFVRHFLESTLAQPVSGAYFESMVQESLKVPARVWKAAWKGRLEEEGAADELHKIEAPTLIVWGDQDDRCSRADQEKLEAGIADSRLVVYQGAGHGLHYEEPERFAPDLVAFVKGRVS
jgi:pimeloyl-ACP methyl ester carboxylesterase